MPSKNIRQHTFTLLMSFRGHALVLTVYTRTCFTCSNHPLCAAAIEGCHVCDHHVPGNPEQDKIKNRTTVDNSVQFFVSIVKGFVHDMQGTRVCLLLSLLPISTLAMASTLITASPTTHSRWARGRSRRKTTLH